MDLIEIFFSCVVLVVFMFFGIKSIRLAIVCSYSVIGKIESIRVEHNDHSTTYLAKCSFTYNGRPYISDEVDVSYSNKVGDQVTIYINPNKPNMAVKSRGTILFVSLICVAMGIVMIGTIAKPILGIITERETAKYEKIRNEASQKEYARRKEERLSKQRNQSDVHILLSGKKRIYEEDEYASIYLFNDLTLHCPPYVTDEVYDQGDVNTKKATLYYKQTGNVYMRVYNFYNKDRVEDGLLYLRKWISKNVKGAKLVKRVQTKDEKAEIYSAAISKNGKKQYRYYALYSEKREMYILVFDGDLKELVNIVKEIY